VPSISDSVLRRQTAGVSHLRAWSNFLSFNDVDRKQEFYSAFFRQIEKFARETDLVGFDSARANGDSLRF
jgi:hypothetical protein